MWLLNLVESHEFELPLYEVVPCRDAAAYAAGEVAAQLVGVEQEHAALALDHEVFVGAAVDQLLVLVVGVAGRVEVTLHRAAAGKDMHLDALEAGNGLLVVFGSGVDHVEHAVRGDADVVDALDERGVLVDAFGFSCAAVVGTVLILFSVDGETHVLAGGNLVHAYDDVLPGADFHAGGIVHRGVVLHDELAVDAAVGVRLVFVDAEFLLVLVVGAVEQRHCDVGGEVGGYRIHLHDLLFGDAVAQRGT